MSSQSTPKYIIVAEDDRFYSNLFRVKLQNLGYEVDVFSDGKQVIAAATKHKPDLILLDLIMPIRDGFETLKELKSDGSALKDVRVLVLSNLSQEEDIKKARDLGADDYFVKADISVVEMVEKVQSVLGDKK